MRGHACKPVLPCAPDRLKYPHGPSSCPTARPPGRLPARPAAHSPTHQLPLDMERLHAISGMRSLAAFAIGHPRAPTLGALLVARATPGAFSEESPGCGAAVQGARGTAACLRLRPAPPRHLGPLRASAVRQHVDGRSWLHSASRRLPGLVAVALCLAHRLREHSVAQATPLLQSLCSAADPIAAIHTLIKVGAQGRGRVQACMLHGRGPAG